MISKEEYYVIASIKSPTTYEADNRRPKFVADDNIEFYRTNDIVTKIEDAYKWEIEEDASEYLSKSILDGYEVRKLNVTYELE